jgi:ribulose-phosphate 3-epimerase
MFKSQVNRFLFGGKMEKEKILIAGDHKAFELKSSVIGFINEMGFEPLDLGTYSKDRVDYPMYALAVAEKVSDGRFKRGIVLCNTGIGVSIVANKLPRVRAALATNADMAEQSRKHNDSNVLAMGAGFVGPLEAKRILEKWLFTDYEGGRHDARLEHISRVEKSLMHELDESEKNEVKIGASLMCANQLNLLNDVNKLVNSGVDMFHVDIIDGVFAPNVSLNPNSVFSLRSHTNLPIDVHLMVENPSNYLQRLISAGTDIITIHVESKSDVKEMLGVIKNSGTKAGLAIEVDTPVESLYPHIDKIDYVLFLCVREKGFEAQPFAPEVIEKIRKFGERIKMNGKDVKIMVDGSVGPRTITHLYRAGARIFVGGTSGLFKQGTFEDNIQQMRSHCY